MFELSLAGMVFATKEHWRKTLVRKGLTPFGVGMGLVGTRVGIEAVGSASSYAIAGEQGLQDWRVASARMFDWGVAEKVPLAGPLLGLVPNPIGVAGVLFDSGMAIGEHTKPVAHAGAMAFKDWLCRTTLTGVPGFDL